MIKKTFFFLTLLVTCSLGRSSLSASLLDFERAMGGTPVPALYLPSFREGGICEKCPWSGRFAFLNGSVETPTTKALAALIFQLVLR